MFLCVVQINGTIRTGKETRHFAKNASTGAIRSLVSELLSEWAGMDIIISGKVSVLRDGLLLSEIRVGDCMTVRSCFVRAQLVSPRGVANAGSLCKSWLGSCGEYVFWDESALAAAPRSQASHRTYRLATLGTPMLLGVRRGRPSSLCTALWLLLRIG